jgi:threonine synthase
MTMSRTFFSHLACSLCGTTHPADRVQTVCTACGAALVAEYDLDAAAKSIPRSSPAGREGTMWRYRELLPLRNATSIVTLGEGWTPLLRAPGVAGRLGVPDLFIKEEGGNPTGSFKARGISMAVSLAKELGIREVCMPSAGNAGGALAAYAAAAGIGAHVFVPRDTPRVNIDEVGFYGGEVTLVDGVISDAARVMNERKAGHDWFDMSTMKEPYRLEGKKTMGYELAEQFAWTLPDVVVYPTGGGTGLIGMWKAFGEMERLGWVSGKKPRMVSVQMAGCAPIVRAFQEKAAKSVFWNDARTISSGLRVPKAFADHMILEALYSSGGCALAVTDESALAMMREGAVRDGLCLCPEGAAALAAVSALRENGFLAGGEKVVVFNTGSGYKYTEIFQSMGALKN